MTGHLRPLHVSFAQPFTSHHTVSFSVKPHAFPSSYSQLVEVIDDPASDCLLLVMGYVEGCTLQPQQLAPGRWQQLPEQTVWRYARDVICGLEYLHAHGVVHGDLKPANFIQVRPSLCVTSC